jgi:hypothetical protein
MERNVMTIKLEAGKYYRTRDGRKVGPVIRYDKGYCWPWSVPQFYFTYADDGKHFVDRRESGADLIAEWVDDPETPKLWRDMTPEEKGALLLAHHDGEVIEWSGIRKGTGGWSEWSDCDDDCLWDGDFDGHGFAYRVKPEPNRVTVRLYGETFHNFNDLLGYDPEYKITFNLIDGEPDVNSIKMEKL